MSDAEGNGLGGEADPALYQVVDREKRPVKIDQVIFPILKASARKKIDLIGTGFFISTNGLFVTARHVLHDVINENRLQTHAIAMVQFLPENHYKIRPVDRCFAHREADVAVGVVRGLEHKIRGAFSNKVVTLTTREPDIGEVVFTYAYPNTQIIRRDASIQELRFSPNFYEGVIEHSYPEGRDRFLIPWPCYQTSIQSHGGASGGPVFDLSSRAFGVNCTGMKGQKLAFASRIKEVLDVVISNVWVPGENAPSPKTIRELARAGFVHFEPSV